MTLEEKIDLRIEREGSPLIIFGDDELAPDFEKRMHENGIAMAIQTPKGHAAYTYLPKSQAFDPDKSGRIPADVAAAALIKSMGVDKSKKYGSV